MGDPRFWDEATTAQKTNKELKELKSWLVPYEGLQVRLQGVKELFPEAKELGDVGLLGELAEELVMVEKGIEELEVRRMLGGELDQNDVYFSINAGAGGTESCDWVEMLARMYCRWAERRGWRVEKVDFVKGDVTGFKQITFRFSGDYAYGYGKSEKGVHRLVRISPFDSNAKRHTSFASVEVFPVIDDTISVEIQPEEIRIDTYRASGAGGQHVNKTDSAVRITHLPTQIVVSCQNERSQLQNKETCFKILRAKLYERERERREAKMREMQGEKKDNSWGSQVRNYVFQPYTMVKDTRTKIESGNINAVMDGEIDSFVYGFLKEFG